MHKKFLRTLAFINEILLVCLPLIITLFVTPVIAMDRWEKEEIDTVLQLSRYFNYCSLNAGKCDNPGLCSRCDVKKKDNLQARLALIQKNLQPYRDDKKATEQRRVKEAKERQREEKLRISLLKKEEKEKNLELNLLASQAEEAKQRRVKEAEERQREEKLRISLLKKEEKEKDLKLNLLASQAEEANLRVKLMKKEEEEANLRIQLMKAQIAALDSSDHQTVLNANHQTTFNANY